MRAIVTMVALASVGCGTSPSESESYLRTTLVVNGEEVAIDSTALAGTSMDYWSCASSIVGSGYGVAIVLVPSQVTTIGEYTASLDLEPPSAALQVFRNTGSGVTFSSVEGGTLIIDELDYDGVVAGTFHDIVMTREDESLTITAESGEFRCGE